jgi:hypothetical protein
MTIAIHTCSLESTSSNVALVGGLDSPITLLLDSSISCLLENDPNSMIFLFVGFKVKKVKKRII